MLTIWLKKHQKVTLDGEVIMWCFKKADTQMKDLPQETLDLVAISNNVSHFYIPPY